MARQRDLVLGLVGVAASAGMAICLQGCRSGAEMRETRLPGAVAAAPAATSVPEPSTRAEPAPPLPGTGVVTGRLVRGCGANPVEGRVSVEVSGAATRTASTFGRGTFRVEGLPADAPITLTATSKGLLPAVHPRLQVPAGGVLDLGDLELGTGTKAEVLVTKDGGVPGEGVAVVLLRKPPGTWTVVFDATRDLAPPASPLPPEASGTTDAHGRVAFDQVPPGSWIVRADASGFAPAARTLSFHEGETPGPTLLRLLPSHSLAGTVRTKDGHGAAGVEVRVRLPDPDSLGALGVLGAFTGPDGRYRMDGLPATAVSVLVRRSPACVWQVAEVFIPDLDTFDIVLGDGVRFHGRVVDDAAGTPIPGAIVQVEVFGNGPALYHNCARTASAGDGAFSFDSLSPGLLSELSVRKDGFVPLRREDLPGKGVLRPLTEEEQVLRLKRGGTLRGKVTDEEGHPIPGVGVQPRLLRCEDGNYRWWSGEIALARTAADGSYRISNCPAGKCLLSVRTPGWVQPEWPVPEPDAERAGELPPSLLVEIPDGGEVERDFTLRRGSVVEGTVRDAEGHPLAGYAVSLKVKDEYEPPAEGAPSDAEGRFRIEGAPALAEATVRAEGSRFSHGVSKPFPIASGTDVKGVEVVVGPPLGIAGTLRREDGAPVVNARLHFNWGHAGPDFSNTWDSMDYEPFTFFPKEDGSFETPVPDPGEFSLYAFAKECAPVVIPSIQVGKGKATRGIEIVFPRGKTLAGRVLDAAGDPVAGAGIYIEHHPLSLRMEDILRRITGEDGKFAIRNLAADPLMLVVRTAGRPEVRMSVEPGAPDIVVTQEAGSRIAGMIIDADTGKAIPGILVVVKETGANVGGILCQRYRSHSTSTDGEGRFSVDELAPRPHTVSVGMEEGLRGPTSDFAPAEIEEVIAGTEDLRIPLTRGLVIAGRLVNQDGSPHEGDMRLRLEPLHPGHYFGHFDRGVGKDGVFRVPGLVPGDYRLTFLEDWYLRRRDEDSAPFPRTAVPMVAAGTEDLVVRVGSGLFIEGKVVDDTGNPPADSGDLHIRPSGGQEGASSDLDYAHVDKDGGFATHGLLPGRTYDLFASGFDGLINGTMRNVAAGAKGVVITLRKGGSLSGRVLLPDGHPAPGGVLVCVKARGTFPPGTEGTSARKPTAMDGTFRVSGLADFEFSVVAGGFRSAFAPTPAPGTYRPGAASIEVRLEPAVTIRGSLVGIDGKPARVPSVAVSQEGLEDEFSYGTVAADGAFQVRGLRRGKVRIWASMDSGWQWLGIFDAPATDLKITVKPDVPLIQRIEALAEEDLQVDNDTYDSIIGGGLAVLPALFARMEQFKSAGGRFYMQLCVKQVLRRDYLGRHPEFKYVSWVEEDDSTILSAWWSGLDRKAFAAGDYRLPPVLKATGADGR
jgi:hypothetical protein